MSKFGNWDIDNVNEDTKVEIFKSKFHEITLLVEGINHCMIGIPYVRPHNPIKQVVEYLINSNYMEESV